MQTDSKPLPALARSELWNYLLSLFRDSPQLAFTVIASSGFFSTFIYLCLFGVNPISVLNTSDIVFNSVVNLFLLVPFYFFFAWCVAEVAAMAAKGARRSRLLAVLWTFAVVLAFLVFAVTLAARFVSPDIAETLTDHVTRLSRDAIGAAAAALMGTALFATACGVLALWLFLKLYKLVTVGIVPKGFLTALLVFILTNALVGLVAHGLYQVSLSSGAAGFMRGRADNLPQQVAGACPGENDLIWTGDRAMVVRCVASGRTFIVYRDYNTVVEER